MIVVFFIASVALNCSFGSEQCTFSANEFKELMDKPFESKVPLPTADCEKLKLDIRFERNVKKHLHLVPECKLDNHQIQKILKTIPLFGKANVNITVFQPKLQELNLFFLVGKVNNLIAFFANEKGKYVSPGNPEKIHWFVVIALQEALEVSGWNEFWKNKKGSFGKFYWMFQVPEICTFVSLKTKLNQLITNKNFFAPAICTSECNIVQNEHLELINVTSTNLKEMMSKFSYFIYYKKCVLQAFLLALKEKNQKEKFKFYYFEGCWRITTFDASFVSCKKVKLKYIEYHQRKRNMVHVIESLNNDPKLWTKEIVIYVLQKFNIAVLDHQSKENSTFIFKKLVELFNLKCPIYNNCVEMFTKKFSIKLGFHQDCFNIKLHEPQEIVCQHYSKSQQKVFV